MVLYHISPVGNIRTLDPECSRGRMMVVWLCDRRRLDWAIAHVVGRVGHCRLWVYRVRVGRKAVRRWREGIYVSSVPVGVDSADRLRLEFGSTSR